MARAIDTSVIVGFLFMTFQNILQSNSIKKIYALYVSANVFSTKVLIGDTIFYVIRNPFTVHCPVHLSI